MKGMFLCGSGCTVDVWNEIRSFFKDIDITFVEYPHEVTQKAESVSGVTKWVYEKYKDEHFDFIVGHSMGGIIALEMVSDFGFKCGKIIFIDSSLKPAEPFYRSLMMPKNMIKYTEVIDMIKKEMTFYNKSLIKSLQDDFDYSGYVLRYNGEVYGIYGDRGIRNYKNRISDLCLNDDVLNKIDLHFVNDACHMVMIENPEKLAEIIRNII